ncbi:MAG: RluA family pseudouridine synthase [Gemmataceae bacterium]
MTPFSVDRQEGGQTLAAVLRRRLQLTWSQTTKLIEEKKVKLAGQICGDAARRVLPGQRIEVVAPKPKKKPPAAPKLGFRETKSAPIPEGVSIVYSEEQVVVVDKPPGLTTMRHAEEAEEFGQRGRKFLPVTLADLLPRLLNDRRPIIAVHRLDRDTSGLVVFARTPEAAKHLGRQFRAHTTLRTYLAVCRGTPANGRIESWFVRDRGDGRRGSGPSGEGQRAVTHIKVIHELGPLSLVECRLETGRTHQVRIHLGEQGTPLAGERLYDRPLHGKPLADPSGAKRIALHAATLGFAHPASGNAMKWASPMPEDMRELVEKFS